MPKALPRRPNLLALFPGISNDWRGQRGTEREWAGGRENMKRKREREKQRRQWQVVTTGHKTWGREEQRGREERWGTDGAREADK